MQTNNGGGEARGGGGCEAGLMRIGAVMDQMSAQARDLKPAVPVPELDLGLLVAFAALGVGTALKATAPDCFTKKNLEAFEQNQANDLEMIAHLVGGMERVPLFSGIVQTMIEDRYGRYVGFGNGDESPAAKGGA